MRKNNNLSFVRFLNRFLKIAIVLMCVVALVWSLVLVYFNYKYNYKEKGEFYFALEVPFYFDIDEELDLVKYTDKENKIKIEQAVGKIAVYNPPSWYFWVFLIGINLFKSTFIIIALILLRKITSNVIENKSFHHRNSIYLRQLGILLIVYSLSISLYKLFVSNWFASQLSTSFERITKFELDLGLIIIGLFTLLLAKIFNYGTDLQEENNLTI